MDLPWHVIWLADNPVEVSNEHLFLLVGHYVPTKVIHVHNKDKPWFDDQCMLASGLKHEAHLWWTSDRSWVYWEEFVRCQVRANEAYSEAKHQFSDRNRDVLMMFIPLISSGPFISPQCLARVLHCLCLLVRVVYWCVNWLVKG